MNKGKRLDGIATLEDLRQRCVMDEDSGCWHLRNCYGRPVSRTRVHVVWMHGVGHVTATRAAWMLSHPGKQLRNSWICFRTCDSYDCVAPTHIAASNKKNWGLHMAATGKARTPAKVRAARIEAAKLPQVKLTPELRQWILESSQSGVEAAHGLGISQGRANAIRAQHRKAQASRPAVSVFDFAMRAAA